MHKVIIIINAGVNTQGAISLGSSHTITMVTALERAISADSNWTEVDVISAASLWSNSLTYSKSNSNLIYCPLTIEIPHKFSFPVQKLYQTCRDIPGLRKWVEQNLGYKTSILDSWLGNLWLPIVVTDKQMLCLSVIGEEVIPNHYKQPVKLDCKVEKSLHSLAQELLTSLDAPPSVYLVQFGLLSNEIIFDRLWPFPAAPAIASIGDSKPPNLFIFHWCCLTQKPMPQVTT
jgi:hypothetical protein